MVVFCSIILFLVLCIDQPTAMQFQRIDFLGYESGVLINSAPGSVRKFSLQ
jgi:hypothetical protein